MRLIIGVSFTKLANACYGLDPAQSAECMPSLPFDGGVWSGIARRLRR
jgi:hypothetical protein